MRKRGGMTIREAIDRSFSMGIALGFELAGLGERVAPMMAGKKEKEIEGILKKEFEKILTLIEQKDEEKTNRTGGN